MAAARWAFEDHRLKQICLKNFEGDGRRRRLDGRSDLHQGERATGNAGRGECAVTKARASAPRPFCRQAAERERGRQGPEGVAVIGLFDDDDQVRAVLEATDWLEPTSVRRSRPQG